MPWVIMKKPAAMARGGLWQMSSWPRTLGNLDKASPRAARCLDPEQYREGCMPPPLHITTRPRHGWNRGKAKGGRMRTNPSFLRPLQRRVQPPSAVVPFPLSPEAGQAAMFALALHGAGRPSDRVRFFQKPEPGLGPNEGLRGEFSNWHVRAPEAGIQARRVTQDYRDTYIGGQSYRWARFDPIEKKPIYELRRIQEIHADLDFYNLPA